MPLILLAAALSGQLGAQSVPAPPRFTLQRIFSRRGILPPAPGALEWTPDSRHVSFFERLPGHKHANLYWVDAATGRRRELATHALFGRGPSAARQYRIHLSEPASLYHAPGYHWSPSGDGILYTAGNQLQFYSLRARMAMKLTRGEGIKFDARLSPDQHWLSYVVHHQLMLQPLRGGGLVQPAGPAFAAIPAAAGVYEGGLDWVYPEELNIRSGYAWSPDSRRLLILQLDERPVHAFPIENYLPHLGEVFRQKYPQAGDANPLARLGIYSLAQRRVVWTQLAGNQNTYLPRFGWLAGGKTAYALVVNRRQTRETLYLINPKSGAARSLLTETTPYWIGVEHDLRFLRNGFLWGSNRGGWHHLYFYSLDGRRVLQLTSGPHNDALEGMGHGWVYFRTTASLPYNTVLERVRLRGGAPQRLSRPSGWQTLALSPDGTRFLETRSDATHPPEILLRAAGGGSRRVLAPAADMSAWKLEAPRYFQVTTADGHTRLWAEMLVPPGYNPRHRYPVIMYQYGGPGSQVVWNRWGGNMMLYNQVLARQGFIVFMADNRSSTAYSTLPERALIQGHFGPVEKADQEAAARWLKSQPFVNPRRVGIWGWSFGGYMTTLEMTTTRHLWHAAVAVAPVVDWRDYDTIYTERYMGLPEANPGGYHDSSSINYAAQLHGKFLLCQGTSDDNVHFQNSVQFIEALIQAQRPFQLMIFPLKTHHIGGSADQTYLFRRMDRFWRHQLLH